MPLHPHPGQHPAPPTPGTPAEVTPPVPPSRSEATTSGTEPAGWPPLGLRAVGAALVAVLPWWLGSRVVALLGLWASRSGWDSPGDTYLGTPHEVGTYHVWDVGFFVDIAEHGSGSTWRSGTPAFMPLMPMVMRWFGAVIGDRPLLAGAIVANGAALVAATALYLLVRMGLTPSRPGSHWAGTYSVAFLLLSPFGLPLFNAYTEPLLLAVALPAWITARHQTWWLAGLLASVGVMARVTGLSVAFGIGVMWLISRWSPGAGGRAGSSWWRWLRDCVHPTLGWVLLPLVSYGAWWAYLHHVTGRWDAVTAAQEEVWNREVVWPWEGFLRSVADLDSPWYGHVMIREMAATLFIGVIVALLIGRRMWPELALAASAWLVLTSTSLWIGGGMRAITALFPFWMLVGTAAAAVARRRNGHAWIAVLLGLSGLALFWSELLLSQIAFIF